MDVLCYYICTYVRDSVLGTNSLYDCSANITPANLYGEDNRQRYYPLQTVSNSYTYENYRLKTISHNGTVNDYYFVCNWRGDVIQIYNASGVWVATYDYDAWGRVSENSTDKDTQNIAEINPIRYRGYYYDSETGLYYVNSRYYDPAVKRFVNSDDSSIVLDDQGKISQYNLFAYCFNNPANMEDKDGEAAANIIGGIVGGVAGAALGVLLAKRLGLTGWKKWALISAATVGGAALGAFLGPYVARLAKSMGAAAKSLFKQTVKYKKITENANKVHHFLGKSQHKFGGLLRKFGGNERKAYNAIYNATFNQVKKKRNNRAF